MNRPDLTESKIVCFDIETYDPLLTEDGPGVYRQDGNILGVAIGDEKGFAEYYNIGHKGCLPEVREKNIKYLTYILGAQNKKLGTNILYDMDWLENWQGIKICGELNDIQVAEPLLDENRRLMGINRPYSLDALSKKYLNKGKYKTEITAFCEQHGLKGDPRKWLWKMSYDLVRQYAIVDVQNPINIFKEQWKLLLEQDLIFLYKIEMGIHRLLLQMRKNGVPVSSKNIENGMQYLYSFIQTRQEAINYKYGKFNFNSSKQIAKVLDKLKIGYPLTEKGNPNLDKKTLKRIDHNLTNNILELRTASKTLSTFFINSFHNHNINGRIHCSFFPLSTDEYGTKSGRFSSAHPNLQQIPAEKPYAQLCRSVFIPEEECTWAKLDYSQIEYRFIAHYAIGEKSDEVREKYNTDPNTDYHQMIMDWTALNRKKAKALNFGASYFMGPGTCSELFGWTYEEAEKLLKRYHEEVPFVKETRGHVVSIAKGRGYIKTILGRRARVTEHMRIHKKEYSMFNRLIQGSAADLLKKAMYDAYNKGLFNVLIPHLTVHDELDISVPIKKEGFEALDELKSVMEKAIILKVPVIVSVETGQSWGEVEKYVRK